MDSGSSSKSHTPVFATPRQIVRPTFPALASFSEEFSRALANGQVTNNGPKVQEFERRLTEYLGVPTVAFSSGQAALMAMLAAADVAGGEVIVPSFTFAATPHAVKWCGAEPVFAEIHDNMSFGLDPADVEKRIGPRTKAVLAMAPYGIAPDYDGLRKVARKHGLKLICDSAAAFGSRIDGRLVGRQCDGHMFSFHATKAFATMEGGCLSSTDERLLERARILRNFGQAGADCILPGFNGKMMEVCALIGLEQLKTIEAAAAVRRRSAMRISEGLRRFQGLRVAEAPASQQPIWLYLPVLIGSVAGGLGRDAICDRLARENLFVRKYYSPACHQMSVYAAARVSLPISEMAAASVIALPIYNDMTDEECDGVVEAFRRALS